MSTWLPTHGLRYLRTGGTLIDLDSTSSAIDLQPQAGMLVRTDLAAHMQRPQRVQRALQAAVAAISAASYATQPHLDVSIADVAWRKLPLGESQLAMTLTFDAGAAALPVVQPLAMRVNSNGTYLVTGGLGGFGRKTAQWLIDHGAKSLVLTGRKRCRYA